MLNFSLLNKLFVGIVVLFFSITLYFDVCFAIPKDHLVNNEKTGWCYPLDDNSNGSVIENISFGFMSFNASSWPYHYAQDFTYGYKEGDSVYAMADGEIIRIRKSGSFGGGSPCDTDYNTLVIKYKYKKHDNTISDVYVFYGHIKNIKGVPENSTEKELITNIPVYKYDKIAELNNPACAGWPVHLHFVVMPDTLINDFYDGYNDVQQKNGRVRAFDCTNCINNPSNSQYIWSKDWIDNKGKQNIPDGDEVFFDTYTPVQRYTVKMYNIDDIATLNINNGDKVFESQWGFSGVYPDWDDIGHQPGDSKEIYLSKEINYGINILNFTLWNEEICCYSSLSLQIMEYGKILDSDSFQITDSSSGFKYNKTFDIYSSYSTNSEQSDNNNNNNNNDDDDTLAQENSNDDVKEDISENNEGAGEDDSTCFIHSILTH